MKTCPPNPDQSQANLVLFCGLPGTLKTFLSVRLSGRLGYGYLPTRAVGEIPRDCPADALRQVRQQRYKSLAAAAHAALKLGANVIIDGGFTTVATRSPVLDRLDPRKAIIVHCLCGDAAVRRERLRVRAGDPGDYERQSTREILRAGESASPAPQDDPEVELSSGRVCAVLLVDTAAMTTQWKGQPPAELSATVPAIVSELLAEYNSSQVPNSYAAALRSHFDELAEEYDESVGWRRDQSLLRALRRPLPRTPSRVLDIGTGTGLAGHWYAEQGHYVAGVDLSPTMLRRAAERLTLTLLGEATRLPFLDDYFDLALVRQCLHYADPARLLGEARRVLRQDGRLAVSAIVCPDEAARTLLEEFKSVTQPMRLRVFTEHDLSEALHEAGFTIDERLHDSLARHEPLRALEKRAAAPPGGWHAFLKNIEQIAAKVAPQMLFSFDGETIRYEQFWVTLWSGRG